MKKKKLKKQSELQKIWHTSSLQCKEHNLVIKNLPQEKNVKKMFNFV